MSEFTEKTDLEIAQESIYHANLYEFTPSAACQALTFDGRQEITLKAEALFCELMRIHEKAYLLASRIEIGDGLYISGDFGSSTGSNGVVVNRWVYYYDGAPFEFTSESAESIAYQSRVLSLVRDNIAIEGEVLGLNG